MPRSTPLMLIAGGWLCLLLLFAGPVLSAQDPPVPAVQPPVAAKSYPFDHCLVSGERLQGDSVVSTIVEGQEYKFINQGSLKKFLKEPQKYLEKFRRDLAESHPKKKVSP